MKIRLEKLAMDLLGQGRTLETVAIRLFRLYREDVHDALKGV